MGIKWKIDPSYFFKNLFLYFCYNKFCNSKGVIGIGFLVVGLLACAMLLVREKKN